VGTSESERPNRGRGGFRLHPVGLAVAVLFVAWAMTPSLIPRDWLFQGLVSGITGVLGYGLGVVIAVLTRRTRLAAWLRGRPRWLRTTGWGVLIVGVIATVVIMTVAAARWQRALGALMGAEIPTTPAYLRCGAMLVAVFMLLLLAARGLRVVARLLARGLHRWVHLPRLLAGGVAVGVVAVLLLVLVRDVVAKSLFRVADSSFAAANEVTPRDLAPPTDPLRSGSPGSLSSWDTLGSWGQTFVTGGPDAAALAVDPVRVYVGLDADDTAQARAERAVAELERTGAFSRRVLAVVTTTGSGWINDTAASSLELMFGGDSAVVATQYSYLPSWVSFLVDRSRARVEAQSLFDAVHARWARLPEASRPKLVVFGESLGSQGSEAAFSGLGDIRERTDGVLWAGPPNSNTLWSELEARRDPGSPEVRPVYADGLVVRFENQQGDTARPDAPWLSPRVLYLQHPSDPVVWWSPALIWSRPAWLAGTRGFDVLPAMSWFPLVTFWQVSADMVNAQRVPDGHGHNYDAQIVAGWVSVAAPPGWSDADTARLQQAVAAVEQP
jgi:uncharacterized membrane protein